jgi:DNA polymerase-3 subunit gamma/tau
MSLYQKYRPQEFDSLSGQEHIKKSLKNALKKGVVAHAYLFCGPRGTGKTTSARLIAKSLNCLNFDAEKVSPCNECEICIGINNGSLIDVVEIDAASNRGIDEIRELKETIRFAPTIAKNKVYIIDEVHMLTNEAFNALLKTLEEPPENVFFVLATTEVHKVPETILSRCQRFDFRRISNSDIVKRLEYIARQEKFDYDIEALEMIAIHSNGGLRDAISLLDQIGSNDKITAEDTRKTLGSSGVDTIYKFIDYLLAGNDAESFKIINSLQEQGISVKQFESDIIKVARERLYLAVEANDTNKKVGLIKLIQLWQEIHNNFHNCAVLELSLEVLTVRFCNDLSDFTPVKTFEDVAKAPSERKTESVPQEVPNVKDSNLVKEKPAIKKDFTKPVSKNVQEPVQKNDESVKTETKPTKKTVFSDLEKDWKQIVEHIGVPTLRITLKNTKIVQTSDNEAQITTFSNFDFNNLKKTENVAIIEKLLNDQLGKSIHIEITKDVVDLKSFAKERTQSSIKPTNSIMDSAAELELPEVNGAMDFDAIDMFEGELID